jgi:hypothetical protein
MITGIYALKETCIYDMIVRVDCKYIGLYSSGNKRDSGLGQVRVAYLKVNFGLRIGRTKWSSGRAG